MAKKWDFSGWATRSNRRCSDGRTIKKDAFIDCDGSTVPLVWNHRHNDPSEVLGHALLEARDGDMYAYCSFNESEKGTEAKELVRHGDIVQLSIYANNLKQSAKNPPCEVYHGTIREVSLVLAGANPGAFIDNVMLHGEKLEDSAEIFHDDEGDGLILYHAEDYDSSFEYFDEDEDDAEEDAEEDAEDDISHADDSKEGDKTVKEVFDTLSDKQKNAVYAVIGLRLKGKESFEHAEDGGSDDSEDTDDSSEETLGDVFNTMTKEQRAAAEWVINEAIENADNNDSDEDENDEEETKTMKHNVFDSYENNAPFLSHSDMEQIFKDAKRLGSLKAAVEDNLESGVLAHAVYNHDEDGEPTTEQTYGIADINYLFPDARTISNTPDMIKRDTEWVATVINGTHHTPFSRVKSMHADITMDEARAKGYIKGKQKTEEVFSLLKRTTDPQTIYKKQKLDRDDIIDITDFDVVSWLKAEMRIMLDEEIARAILIGDGRPAGDDKIDETHIRPIYNDADLYTVKVPVKVEASATGDAKAKAMLDAAVRARKLYKGSGNPIFFTTEDWLTEILLLEDRIGHKLYKSEAEVATALRVGKIVTVEVMEGQKIAIKDKESGTSTDKEFIGVMVNLKDYNVGTNKGGQTSFFDDFDIDYNQQKYLLETRLSGALIKPYSALSFYVEEGSSDDEG